MGKISKHLGKPRKSLKVNKHTPKKLAVLEETEPGSFGRLLSKKNDSKSNKATESLQMDQSATQDVLKKYEISLSDIHSAIDGVLKFHKENPKMKNQLFNERFPISLTVNCHKIPRGYSKLFRVPLKNSLLTADDEVCLIVSEVKGIGNKEHEKHIEHYEDLLAKKGVTNIKKIMTFHEFRTEHETFEQKSRLVDFYDMFLVCGKISGKVVKKCGKMFYKKRKVPIPIKLQASKLKTQIDQSLAKSFFHVHLRGDSYNLQFGHSQMETTKIAENLLSVLEFLDKNFPGGFDNIKGLHVYAPRSTSIPVFVSTKSIKDIGKVTTNTSKQGVSKNIRGELTTLPDAEVVVKPSGRVIVKRIPSETVETADEKITDEDIIKANKEDDEETRKMVKENKKLKNKNVPSTASGKVAKKKVKRESAKNFETEKKITAVIEEATKENKLVTKKSNLKKKEVSSSASKDKSMKIEKPIKVFNGDAKIANKKQKTIKNKVGMKASKLKDDKKKQRKMKAGLVV